MLWPGYEAVTGCGTKIPEGRSTCRIMDQPLATFCTREGCDSRRPRDRRRLAGSDRKKNPPLFRSQAGGDMGGICSRVFLGGSTWGILGRYLQVGRPQV